MGLQPFVEEKFRSNVVISIKYPQGVDDIKFRKYLENNYNIVVTGGFGEVKGKIFRIGNMGIIERSKILPTIIAVGYSMIAQGINVNVEKAIEVAEEKLKGLDNI
jgi:Serine-pyruvate aminotransferase/archaeal aspartate aminotransferase